MKIAILGAGAMGSTFGGLLSRAGHEVTLIDVSREAVDAINHQGLTIRTKAGTEEIFRVRAVTPGSDTCGQVDLLIVFVKCYHTVGAVTAALPLLGPDTMVLSLQNGWGNGPRIAAIVGASRVVLGVCYHSATVLGPGRVLHAGQGATFIGAYDGAPASRVQLIADLLTGAGIKVEPKAAVLTEIWRKLALNVATLPTASLLRVTAEKLLQTAEMQSLMKALLAEVALVAQAQGIPLDAAERWKTTSELLARLAPGSKGSMVQDIEKGRTTEIDVMCGAVVEAGRKASIPTPYNEAMLCLIKGLEATFVA